MLGMRNDADLRTMFFVSAYFCLFGVTWQSYYTLGGCVWWILWGLTCFFSFTGAVAVHNSIHCPVFHSSLANRVFQVVLSLTYGHPVSNYVPGHNLSHHQNTQKVKDVMRTTKMRFRWHLLNGLLFFPIIGLGMLGNDKAYFDVQRRDKRPIYKQMKIEQLIVFTLAGVLAILDFRRWVVCAFLPHLLAKDCIISLNMLQHDGCDEQSEFNHSRNFTSPILNFFFYNNGYHSVHHMQPGLHWSALRHKHEELVKPNMHPNLDQSSMTLYMIKTFIYPGKRITYLGEPVVLPPDLPDEPWFFATTETYSSAGDKYE